MNQTMIIKIMLSVVTIIGGYELLHFFMQKNLLKTNHKYELEEESLRFRNTKEIIRLMKKQTSNDTSMDINNLSSTTE